MKVAICQSNYIPWKGYFDLIGLADLFIFLDNVQYTTGDWRNRNRIKEQDGVKWLTIPCGTNINRLICEVELNDHRWQQNHWNRITHAYKKAPYFNYYADFFSDFYLGKRWLTLSEFNQELIKRISGELLGIDTKITDSRSYAATGDKVDRLLCILKGEGATQYLSGPAAKDYLDEEYFRREGIEVEWMSYRNYPEYDQLYPPFEHGVSILDLLFHVGTDARSYMQFLRKNPS